MPSLHFVSLNYFSELFIAVEWFDVMPCADQLLLNSFKLRGNSAYGHLSTNNTVSECLF